MGLLQQRETRLLETIDAKPIPPPHPESMATLLIHVDATCTFKCILVIGGRAAPVREWSLAGITTQNGMPTSTNEEVSRMQ